MLSAFILAFLPFTTNDNVLLKKATSEKPKLNLKNQCLGV